MSSVPGYAHNILTDAAAIREIVPEWRALWQRCPRATTFQRPEWLLTWIETFQPTEARMIEVRKQGRLAGIIPLLMYPRESKRVLAFMGGGVSDYLDALIDPEIVREVLEVFWNVVEQEVSGWDILELTDVPASSPLLHLRQDAEVELRPHDICPILPLPMRVEDLGTIVPFRKMANLRNAGNRLARAGNVLLETATEENVLPMLDDMFRLHTIRWERAGQTGVLAETAIREFHRRVAIPLVEQGVLRLQALNLNHQAIAFLYTLWEKDSVLLYLHAFDPDYAGCSPGTYIFASVIKQAIRAGKSSVNFLRGRESYKYSWGARDSGTFAVRAECGAWKKNATLATA